MVDDNARIMSTLPAWMWLPWVLSCILWCGYVALFLFVLRTSPDWWRYFCIGFWWLIGGAVYLGLLKFAAWVKVEILRV